MRYYSSIATPKTLSTTITSSSNSVALSDLVGLPNSYPYTLVLEPDSASEEIVTVTALVSGTTLSITRAQDGTSATAHNAGTAARHMVTARDIREPQEHIDNSALHVPTQATHSGKFLTTNGSATSWASALTPTGSQTITNKTIDYNSNTILNLPATGNSSISDILMLGGM